MMCAIMNKLRVISAAARHRPVFDLRIPLLLYPGTLTPPGVRPEIAPIAFNSGLTQPLFTRLANLAQNTLCANSKTTIVTKSSRDFLYFLHLLMADIAISVCAF